VLCLNKLSKNFDKGRITILSSSWWRMDSSDLDPR